MTDNYKWKSELHLYSIIKNKWGSAIHQYRPPFLGRQSLDIYLPSKKIAIEYQGDQHFKPIDYFGGRKKFKHQKRNDKIKIKLCKQNNIKVIYFTKNKLYDNKYFNNVKIFTNEIKLMNYLKWYNFNKSLCGLIKYLFICIMFILLLYNMNDVINFLKEFINDCRFI